VLSVVCSCSELRGGVLSCWCCGFDTLALVSWKFEKLELRASPSDDDLSKLPGGHEAPVDGGDFREPQHLLDRGVIPDCRSHLTSRPLQADNDAAMPAIGPHYGRYQRPFADSFRP